MLELNDYLQQHLPANHTFDWVLNCQGQVYRQIKRRRTVEFTLEGKRFFVKSQRGCGWVEILRDLFRARKPVTSAKSEWEAIELLQTLGIPTLKVVGKGLRGWNPARLESFVVTEALDGMISLEELTRDWRGLAGKQRTLLKRTLLRKAAVLASALHNNGINHRDFYLCHFLVRDRRWEDWQPGESLELFLIDLHRVQIRSHVPRRWQVKDLGGLLFSALDCGLTRRDLIRFVRFYKNAPWRESLTEDDHLWRCVLKNAQNLYSAFHKRPPPSFP